MTVRVYRSSDGGATGVAGAAGSLITVLDSVLVNGYNSKTVTITRSGSTATATCTAHGFPVDGITRIAVSGAGQAEYNIETYITNVTANTFDYTVAGAPATPATGTITAIVAGSGWAKTYTGTNLAAYTAPSGSSGARKLRVDDTGTTVGRIVGYESMSGISAGLTGPMPTAAQISGGAYWHKSTTADATARPWIIVTNGNTIWIWVGSLLTTANIYSNSAYSFLGGYGDLTSLKASDTYNQFIIGGGTSAGLNSGFCITMAAPVSATTIANHYVQRAVSGAGGSLGVAKVTAPGVGTVTMYNPLQYPNPLSGGANAHQVQCLETATLRFIRGTYPGLWDTEIGQYSSLGTQYVNGDVLEGSGTLAGKKFMVLTTAFTASSTWGSILVEISNTW